METVTATASKTTVRNYFVCCIALPHSDTIRLIALPPPLIPVIRLAILEGWSKPIQRERELHGSYEFKLKGFPFASWGKDTVWSQRLILSILKAMARNGWNLLGTGDMSKVTYSRDSMFFENSDPDPDPQIFSMSFNRADRIRVIDAPSMMPEVKRAVIYQWPKGIKHEKDYYGSLELKLNGHPFTSGDCTCRCTDSPETIQSRLVFGQIIANLRTVGFKLYGAMDVTRVEEDRDLDSFFFRRIGPYWG